MLRKRRYLQQYQECSLYVPYPLILRYFLFGNGAPLLDEREEAVGHLRKLHGTLGDLLAAADSGHLDDALGQGLAAEAARYAKRAARALRDDPMPYVASGLLNGLLAVCGFPGVGGFIGGIALNIRKNTGKTS